MTLQKKNWTVKEILTWISHKFSHNKIHSPLLDAQLLLCHVLNFTNRIDLYLKSEVILKQDQLNLLRSLVKRRLLHEPVAYIINQKYWHNLDLYIDNHVLIPRPETESLLDFIIESVRDFHLEPNIIFDFCTGSGCLAIALGKNFPNAQVFAYDISAEALEVAKKNALRNEVNNITFNELNLLNESSYEFLRTHLQKADIITVNPPYISTEQWHTLESEVKDYEPKISLISENNGLLLGQTIFEAIKKFHLLNEKSIFGMELDHKQPEKILIAQEHKKILSLKVQNWEKPINEWFILKDLENKERFLVKIWG